MSNRIKANLTKLFKNHRIVFWYDDHKDLRDEFEALELDDIEKIVLDNNEFGVKYRILREEPKQQFLLYHEGPEPDYLDNWLLDVQLAHTQFKTDQISIWLSELALTPDFEEVLRAHASFFESDSRMQALKSLIEREDTVADLELKMLAVCTKSDPILDLIIEALLKELAEDKNDKLIMLQKYGLEDVLWKKVRGVYGYQNDEPSIRDFAIELFQSSYELSTKGTSNLLPDALVFFKRWKDNRKQKEAFEVLSDKCATILSIENDLNDRDLDSVLDVDYFKLIDLRIISDLINKVLNSDVTSDKVSVWVRQRRQSHWYSSFEHMYQAIDYAAQFIHQLNQVDLTMSSLTDGVERYRDSWFRVDQLYRKYVYHKIKADQPTLLGQLTEKVQGLYSNNYLLQLGNNFSETIHKGDEWRADSIPLQSSFFERYVRPFITSNKKVYVIISDAFRYEIADELKQKIRQEDRFSAELTPMLSMLPSYTQLGMAALLPHQKLSLAEDGKGSVIIDGTSTQGTEQRHKILNNALNGRGLAIQSDKFKQMGRPERRELFKDNDVIYFYHNRIDHTGDKLKSEGEAFVAAQDTVEELIDMIKKLAATNAYNILITADHGFIYQNNELDESDFSMALPDGDIMTSARRFILGKGLAESPSLYHFTSSQLGLEGDIEVQVPTSINRLRLKGSGSRFVHGGASLQEVVVPVLAINKARESDVRLVDIEVLKRQNSLITSGQLGIMLYQSEPVTDKVQPRVVRLGLYTKEGELISDTREINFDIRSDNARDREERVQLLLSHEADNYNGMDVFLKLEEKVPGTSKYKEYQSFTYTIRRSFTRDFDF